MLFQPTQCLAKLDHLGGERGIHLRLVGDDALFLGGWHAPFGIGLINDGMFQNGWWGLLWFSLKLWMFMFFFVWLRGTLPRTRYDQFMRFGWKFLIPVTVAWVIAVAFIRGADAQSSTFVDGLRDIAAAAGVDVAYVHRAFGSKAEIFRQALLALAPLDDIAAGDPDGATMINRICDLAFLRDPRKVEDVRPLHLLTQSSLCSEARAIIAQFFGTSLGRVDV